MPIETLLFLASVLVVGYQELKYIMAHEPAKYYICYSTTKRSRERAAALRRQLRINPDGPDMTNAC